ncbi:hypothetical protein OG455_27180 [Kitasatospora sp. NBC_01287]|uniref:hypothetical protein n=1 Tax=Kitasatospora sp. NBC_01287 TaxID=2903573 RepID=UPI00225344C7|nr:hypothetical protein [Kitasatospora sp. NBC_01287]MCX4749147.1 hypothetical protein [Kitasatospora sp. NBC_01287]
MLRGATARYPGGDVVAEVIEDGGRRSARRARHLIAAHIHRRNDVPLDHGRVLRDENTWPLFWARTVAQPTGLGILLITHRDLSEVAASKQELRLLPLMMAAIAPVWGRRDYWALAPCAVQYLRSNVPPEWAREQEAP